LPVGKSEATQSLIKSPGQSSRRPLHMKTQTAIANLQRSPVRNFGGS
jgi:hypothetical protein